MYACILPKPYTTLKLYVNVKTKPLKFRKYLKLFMRCFWPYYLHKLQEFISESLMIHFLSGYKITETTDT